jgi:thiol-disulfide isomerase/thioredoxin
MPIPFRRLAGKPGAAKAAPKGAAAKPGASLGEIMGAFDDKQKTEQEELQRERWDAIEAYVKANGSAKDAEEARKALVDIAEELEDWAKTLSSADAFLAAHADSKSKVEVQVSRAGALANLGKDADAKSAYEGITKDLNIEKDGVQSCFAVWSAYADLLASMGDIEGAKKAYESGKDMCHHPQVEQIFNAQALALDKIGTTPTAFPETAKDLDGKAVQVGDFKGKVLLIDFWATWCGPCRAEMPNVVAAYAKFHEKGLEIVGVTLDKPGDGDKVRDFITSHKMPWRQVYYPEGQNEVAETYGVESIPHTMLIGRDGNIIRVGLRGPALARAIEKAISAPAAKGS